VGCARTEAPGLVRGAPDTRLVEVVLVILMLGTRHVQLQEVCRGRGGPTSLGHLKGSGWKGLTFPIRGSAGRTYKCVPGSPDDAHKEGDREHGLLFPVGRGRGFLLWQEGVQRNGPTRNATTLPNVPNVRGMITEAGALTCDRAVKSTSSLQPYSEASGPWISFSRSPGALVGWGSPWPLALRHGASRAG